VVVALAALVPPSSSVLPPGAGNKAEKAIQPKKDRAKKPEKRYVDESVVDRNVHAPAVRRHDDGDSAAIPTVEQTQLVSVGTSSPSLGGGVGAVYGSIDDLATTRTAQECRRWLAES
jgi:hypothetical protein